MFILPPFCLGNMINCQQFCTKTATITPITPITSNGWRSRITRPSRRNVILSRNVFRHCIIPTRSVAVRKNKVAYVVGMHPLNGRTLRVDLCAHFMPSAATRRTPWVCGRGAPIHCNRRWRRISIVGGGGVWRRCTGYTATNHGNQAANKASLKWIRYRDYVLTKHNNTICQLTTQNRTQLCIKGLTHSHIIVNKLTNLTTKLKTRNKAVVLLIVGRAHYNRVWTLDMTRTMKFTFN